MKFQTLIEAIVAADQGRFLGDDLEDVYSTLASQEKNQLHAALVRQADIVAKDKRASRDVKSAWACMAAVSVADPIRDFIKAMRPEYRTELEAMEPTEAFAALPHFQELYALTRRFVPAGAPKIERSDLIAAAWTQLRNPQE